MISFCRYFLCSWFLPSFILCLFSIPWYSLDFLSLLGFLCRVSCSCIFVLVVTRDVRYPLKLRPHSTLRCVFSVRRVDGTTLPDKQIFFSFFLIISPTTHQLETLKTVFSPFPCFYHILFRRTQKPVLESWIFIYHSFCVCCLFSLLLLYPQAVVSFF